MLRKYLPQRTQGTRRFGRFLTTLFSVSSASSVVASCISAAVVIGHPPPAAAQMAGTPAPGYKRESGTPASALPAPLREIGFDQNLDQQIPLDTPFIDERGRSVPIGRYFGARPVVLVFAYYDCPMLCTQVLNALASSLDVLSLEASRDFDVVVVSFDPREKSELAAAKKASVLQRYRRPGAEAGWHFLTGEQPSIESITGASGFRFVWDAKLKQFAHPTGIVVVSPAGRVSRYLFGIDFGPRDLRLAIVEASAGKIGSPIDSFLLYCYHYDPMTGRYGLVIMRVLRIAAIATVLLLGTFIGIMLRLERRPSTKHFPSTRHLPGTGHKAPGTS
jgi:protein SCO1